VRLTHIPWAEAPLPGFQEGPHPTAATPLQTHRHRK
jgi:hypothetical protein